MGVVVTVAVLGAGPASMARTGANASQLAAPLPRPVVYRLPLDGAPALVRGFDPPASAFEAGHRGVDLRVPERGAVRAAADGVVTFAGVVAGRGIVVVLHADGIRTEYEPVRPAVHSGLSVERGAAIGYVDGRHGACPANRCLHWGARRGTTYLDPMSLLRPLGVVRLVPWTR